MSPQTVIIITIFILSMPFLLVIGILFLKWRDIMVWLYPDRYTSVTMLCLDDEVMNWIEKKNDDLVMEFRGMDYNMFYPDKQPTQDEVDEINNIKDLKERAKKIKEIKDNSIKVVYRQGRLAHFTFIEGNPRPLDLRNLKENFTAKSSIEKQRRLIDLTRLFNSVGSSGFAGFWDKWGIWIMLGFGILMFILTVSNQSTINLSPESIKALKGS